MKCGVQSWPYGWYCINQLINNALALPRNLFIIQRIKRKRQIIGTKSVTFEYRHEANVVPECLPVFPKVEQRHFAFLVPSQGIRHLDQRLLFGMMSQLSTLLQKPAVSAKPLVALVSRHIFERFVAMYQGISVAVTGRCGQLNGHFGQLFNVLQQVEQPRVADGVQLGRELGV